MLNLEEKSISNRMRKVFIIGKLFVTIGSAATCFFVLENYHMELGAEEITSPLYPTVVTAIIVYLLAGVFISILDVAAETLLICYLADTEM